MEIYQKQDLKIVINRLKNKEIGILPTDTIYGISALISDYALRKKINKIKNSDSNKNIIILVSKIKQIQKIADISKKQILLFKNPNPTTIVCNINKYYDHNISSTNTIAIRLVKSKLLKKIINKTGPLYSTSANMSNKQYIGSLENFKKLKVDFILFDDISSSTHSTIYDLINKKYIR